MIGTVAQRREAKVAAIVAAAWDLARIHGIGGLSLHVLAREVGMRQPSLYAYFDSKNALYDAMFADGNRQLLERLDAVKLPSEPRAAVRTFMRAFVNFAVDDLARYTLLFSAPDPRLRAVGRVVCVRGGSARAGRRSPARRRRREPGRHRLLRRDGRRARRRADQQRARWPALDPPPEPSRRPVHR